MSYYSHGWNGLVGISNDLNSLLHDEELGRTGDGSPAIRRCERFNEQAKSGALDSLSDAEYDAKLHVVESDVDVYHERIRHMMVYGALAHGAAESVLCEQDISDHLRFAVNKISGLTDDQKSDILQDVLRLQEKISLYCRK